MDRDQRDYAISRARDIRDDHIREFNAAHTSWGVFMTAKEKVKALRKGEFTVKPDRLIRYDRIHNGEITAALAFDGESPTVCNDKAIKAFSIAEAQRFTSVVDAIMLGDCAAARALIKDYGSLTGAGGFCTPTPKPVAKGHK